MHFALRTGTHESNAAFWPPVLPGCDRNEAEAWSLPPTLCQLTCPCKICKAGFSFCSFSALALPLQPAALGRVLVGRVCYFRHIPSPATLAPAPAQGTETASCLYLYQLHTEDLNSSLSLCSFFPPPFLSDNSVPAKPPELQPAAGTAVLTTAPFVGKSSQS